MKNTFGTNVCVTLFGESHGEAIGVVLDGMAPGIAIDTAFIASQLEKRRPVGDISSARVEPDHFQIVSGVLAGKTTGAPLCIIIPNEDIRSADYEDLQGIARPGHADYTAWKKYHGFADTRGSGHFSGRLTAALTAVGAIALCALEGKGITVGTHIARCAGIDDRPFAQEEAALAADIAQVNSKDFAVLDEDAGARMQEAIRAAAAEGDSVGGILETAVVGIPAGLGEPWFDSLEGLLSHALFSIPAVKGVTFGAGFGFADLRGSSANDSFYLDDGAVRTRTNHNGGINGGISNGMPLVLSLVVKPTPSIAQTQDTVDFIQGRETEIEITGRHDPAIVHRARVVVDSLTALVLCDALTTRYGSTWLGE